MASAMKEAVCLFALVRTCSLSFAALRLLGELHGLNCGERPTNRAKGWRWRTPVGGSGRSRCRPWLCSEASAPSPCVADAARCDVGGVEVGLEKFQRWLAVDPTTMEFRNWTGQVEDDPRLVAGNLSFSDSTLSRLGARGDRPVVAESSQRRLQIQRPNPVVRRCSLPGLESASRRSGCAESVSTWQRREADLWRDGPADHSQLAALPQGRLGPGSSCHFSP